MAWAEFTALPVFQIIGLSAIGLVCIFGLIGNSLSAIVLSRVKWKSSVVITVLGLTICDSITLFMELFILCLTNLTPASFVSSIVPAVPWLFTLTSMGQGGSVYFTMLISAERYIALCQPFKVRIWCTTRNALFACATVFAMAILTSLPRLFQYEVSKVYSNTTGLNLTDEEAADAWQWTISEPSTSQLYKHLNNTLLIGFRFVLPWIALAVLNMLIYLQIRRTNKCRQEMNEQQQNDVSIAKTLLCVVMVFFISNVPFGIAYLESALWGQISATFSILAELFIVLNASVNFLIYVFLGKRFRNTLLLILSKNCCFKYCVNAPMSGHSHAMSNLSSRSTVTMVSTGEGEDA